ncbi:hypothetical protein OSTOST_02400, partial [Ostertagia ostertagi]
VKYWCGRKAAFGNSYASFIYGVNIVGYIVTFFLISASYFKSRFWMDSKMSKIQQAKIRYQLIISVLSIILISIPNGLSLFAQYITAVADAVAKPSTYLICVNSSINIFVYLALYDEFRMEFKRCILRKAPKASSITTLRIRFSSEWAQMERQYAQAV